MSYANLLLYMRTLPDYSATKKDKAGGEQERIDADDPANNAKIEKLLFGNG